jgi:hypothetical protein
MTMVITLSFLGLEGQTSSSLEDRWHRPWPPSQLSTEEGRKVAMVILPFFLGIGRADLLS